MYEVSWDGKKFYTDSGYDAVALATLVGGIARVSVKNIGADVIYRDSSSASNDKLVKP